MPPLPSLSDIKTYVGLTGSQDDALLNSLRVDAIAAAGRDTGRTFSASSNTTTMYSSDGNSSLTVHDRPITDASRIVTLAGTTMTENVNVWFLPDRRDPNISTTIQLRVYDQSRGEWYKSDPMWWDKNLDRRGYGPGYPNDLIISGILGIPFPASDVCWAVKFKWASLYWQAKSSASGVVSTPGGTEIDVEGESRRYDRFVSQWSIRTAVASG